MEGSCIVESELGQSRTISIQGSVLAAGLDRVCESSLRTCQCASSPSRTCTTSEIREMRSVTGSLRWITGGTRPDDSFATSRLQRKQAPHLGSDHKRAVQTVKRQIGQPEIGLRFRPLSTKMCVVVSTDSALRNADADPDEEGSDDEWLARAKQKGIRVRSQHGPWSVW